MNSIKKLVKRNKKLLYFCRAIKGYKQEDIYNVVMKEHQFGRIQIENMNYENELIYEIEIGGKGGGFFAAYFRMLDALAYADYLGIKPYVHCSEDYIYTDEKNFLGTNNPFEYYFEQVSDVKNIEKCEGERYTYSVIKFIPEHLQYIRLGIVDTFVKHHRLSTEQKDMYMERVAKTSEKYIKFNQNIANILEKDMNEMLKGKKTLGVHARGGEWRKPVLDHPVAVTLEEHIEHVKKTMKEYEFEQIFLATDEVEAIEAFREEFGDKVVYYEDTFRGEGGQWLLGMGSEREHHNYKLGLEVLRDAETLVYCDGLIAGLSNISMYVDMKQRILKRVPDYFYINDKGSNDVGRSVQSILKEADKKKKK